MPGWHEATKQWQGEGKVQMLGIVQEQHPQRARLFMQWKQMGWPILVDSLDLLEVPVVPVTLAIDEYGIIRIVKPIFAEAGSLDRDFLDRTYEKPDDLHPPLASPTDPDRLRPKSEKATAAEWRIYADALVLWGDSSRLSDAIDAYHKAIEHEPTHAFSHFRLGVALRKRYDSGSRRPGDFQAAVESWAQALDLDPNNYIWRRRIQQFGPRLEKPYSFYDWVNEARRDILARGETPVPLPVEPGGAEFAYPTKEFAAGTATVREPDPDARIHRDERGYVRVETTVVPAAVAPGSTARVHVVLRPEPAVKAHWNNEVGGTSLWIDPPNGWIVDNRLLTSPPPKQTVSLEPRTFEFEIRCPADAKPGTVTMPAYALYYVCEDVDGTCLYRRQEVRVRIRVAG